jgi:2-phospho-L-lactate guanylyltransferase
VLAIVPVNSPLSAKSRLGPLLSPAQRGELARSMLADVLAACRASRWVEAVLVVTPDLELAPRGTDVIRDPGNGHARAIALALAEAPVAAGALILMADCPLVPVETIDALARAALPIALCPAQDGGTNALAMRPANVFMPTFGEPDGASANVEQARRLGFEAAVIDDPLVALDVDSPEDVRRVLELGHGTMTHRFLDRALAAPAELPGRGG